MRLAVGHARRVVSRPSASTRARRSPSGNRSSGSTDAATRSVRQQVEGDVDHRHLALQIRGRWLLPAEACLELQERQRHAVAQAEHLAVEDPVPRQRGRRGDHLRELRADVVQVAAVEADLGRPACAAGRGCRRTCPPPRPAAPRRLSTSSSSATGEASIDFSGRNRAARPRSSAPSRARTAVLPRSPVSMPAHWTSAKVALERLGDGRLQMALAQPDAQLALRHLDHVLGGGGIAPRQQVAQDARSWPPVRAPRRSRRTRQPRPAGVGGSPSGSWPPPASSRPTA